MKGQQTLNSLNQLDQILETQSQQPTQRSQVTFKEALITENKSTNIIFDNKVNKIKQKQPRSILKSFNANAQFWKKEVKHMESPFSSSFINQLVKIQQSQWARLSQRKQQKKKFLLQYYLNLHRGLGYTLCFQESYARLSQAHLDKAYDNEERQLQKKSKPSLFEQIKQARHQDLVNQSSNKQDLSEQDVRMRVFTISQGNVSKPYNKQEDILIQEMTSSIQQGLPTFTYRQSRRQAGETPEFGLLPPKQNKRGQTIQTNQDNMQVETTQQQPNQNEQRQIMPYEVGSSQEHMQQGIQNQQEVGVPLPIDFEYQIRQIVSQNNFVNSIREFVQSQLAYNVNQLEFKGQRVLEYVTASQQQSDEDLQRLRLETQSSALYLQNSLQSWSQQVDQNVSNLWENSRVSLEQCAHKIEDIYSILSNVNIFTQSSDNQTKDLQDKVKILYDGINNFGTKINEEFSKVVVDHQNFNVSIQTLFSMQKTLDERNSNIEEYIENEVKEANIQESKFNEQLQLKTQQITSLQEKVKELENNIQSLQQSDWQKQNDIIQDLQQRLQSMEENNSSLRYKFGVIEGIATTFLTNQHAIMDVYQARVKSIEGMEQQIYNFQQECQDNKNKLQQQLQLSNQNPTPLINPAQFIQKNEQSNSNNNTPQSVAKGIPIQGQNNLQYVYPIQYGNDYQNVQQPNQPTQYANQNYQLPNIEGSSTFYNGNNNLNNYPPQNGYQQTQPIQGINQTQDMYARPGIYQLPSHVNISQPQPQPYYNQFNNQGYQKFNYNETFEEGKNPSKFLQRFEDKALKAQLTEQQMLKEIQYCLQYDTESWYQEQIEMDGFSSWEDFKQKFIQEFSTETETALLKLSSMRQLPNQSISEFLTQLRKIAEPAVISDSKLKIYFLNGIQIPEIRMECQKLLGIDRSRLVGKSTTTLKNILTQICQNTHISDTLKPRVSYPPKSYPSSGSSTTSKGDTKSSIGGSKPPYSKPKVPFKKDSTYKPRSSTITAEEEANINLLSQPLNTINEEQEILQYEDQPDNPDIVYEQQDEDQNPRQCDRILVSNCQSEPLASEQAKEQVMDQSNQNPQDYQFSSAIQTNFDKINKRLSEFGNKDRTTRSIPIQEEQLLRESPHQLIKAFKFLHKIFKSDTNYLKDKDILEQLSRLESLIEQKHNRLLDTQYEMRDFGNSIVRSNLFTRKVVQQSFHCAQNMYYIPLQFEQNPVNALLDTGSVVTVISQKFIDKINYQVEDNLAMVKMITANGGEEKVPEITDAKITISRGFTVVGSVLISQATDYEMLVGLDITDSINGFVDPNTMQFHYFIQQLQEHRRLQALKLDVGYYKSNNRVVYREGNHHFIQEYK